MSIREERIRQPGNKRTTVWYSYLVRAYVFAQACPGCNIIPPLASIGTKVDISQFPPPDSLTDPELAGPVQLLKSGKFDIPIEQLTGVNSSASEQVQYELCLNLLAGVRMDKDAAVFQPC
jgi:hypothetical protein